MIILSPFESGKFRLTSPFGWRVLNGAKDYHRGIDIVDSGGSGMVTAVTSGIVSQSRIVTNHSNATWQWGNYVSYKTDDGYTIYCCHLSQRLVARGMKVSPGDPIGIMGNTGYSFGAHTHFEVRNSKWVSINAAEFLGIPNTVGSYYMPTLAQILKEGTEDSEKIEATKIRVGNKVRIKVFTKVVGNKKYAPTYTGTGGTFVVYYDSYDVISVNGDRVVIGKDGQVTAAVDYGILEKI